MSKVKIEGNASGTGTFTIASPNSSTDRTITLPDATGTLVHADTSGNVGIGTSSPSTSKLTVKSDASSDTPNIRIETFRPNIRFADLSTSAVDAEIKMDGNALRFNLSAEVDNDTALTERMRINSDGRIGVASSGLTAVQFAMEINGQSWFAVWDDDAGNDKFRVASSGNVQNSNNSYGAISDQKLKENIVDTTNKLEDLKRVQIKNYNFIGDSQKQIGVIAQELETVFPSMVEEHPDLDEDGNDLGTVTKSVKYSVFVPILIKSLQEQQTIIEDLKTRIEALEAGV